MVDWPFLFLKLSERKLLFVLLNLCVFPCPAGFSFYNFLPVIAKLPKLCVLKYKYLLDLLTLVWSSLEDKIWFKAQCHREEGIWAKKQLCTVTLVRINQRFVLQGSSIPYPTSTMNRSVALKGTVSSKLIFGNHSWAIWHAVSLNFNWTENSVKLLYESKQWNKRYLCPKQKTKILQTYYIWNAKVVGLFWKWVC